LQVSKIRQGHQIKLVKVATLLISIDWIPSDQILTDWILADWIRSDQILTDWFPSDQILTGWIHSDQILTDLIPAWYKQDWAYN
jgi:hypothetical protein